MLHEKAKSKYDEDVENMKVKSELSPDLRNAPLVNLDQSIPLHYNKTDYRAHLNHDQVWYDIMNAQSQPIMDYGIDFMEDYVKDHPESHVDYKYNRKVLPNGEIPDFLVNI